MASSAVAGAAEDEMSGILAKRSKWRKDWENRFFKLVALEDDEGPGAGGTTDLSSDQQLIRQMEKMAAQIKSNRDEGSRDSITLDDSTLRRDVELDACFWAVK